MAGRSLAAILAVCLGASGCSFGEPSPPDSSADTLEQVTEEERAALRSLAQASEMMAELQRAEGELVRRCMAEKGSPYIPTVVRDDNTFTTYEPMSVEMATRYGYGWMFGHTEESDAANAEHDRLLTSMTDAEREKQTIDLGGEPRGPVGRVELEGVVFEYALAGCQYEVEELLYGDGKAWNQAMFTVLMARPLSARYLHESDAVKEAAGRWSECMAEGDRVFSGPGEAQEAGLAMSLRPEPGQTDGGEYIGPTPEEIELAVADATCREATGYDETMAKLFDAAAQYALTHEGEILKVIEMGTQAQATARELLG